MASSALTLCRQIFDSGDTAADPSGPHALFVQLTSLGVEVVEDPQGPIYVIDQSVVREVLRSTDYEVDLGGRCETPSAPWAVSAWMDVLTGSRHAHIRRSVARALAGVQPGIEKFVSNQAAAVTEVLASRAEFDCVSNLARPLQMGLYREWLGMDLALFRDLGPLLHELASRLASGGSFDAIHAVSEDLNGIDLRQRLRPSRFAEALRASGLAEQEVHSILLNLAVNAQPLGDALTMILLSRYEQSPSERPELTLRQVASLLGERPVLRVIPRWSKRGLVVGDVRVAAGRQVILFVTHAVGEVDNSFGAGSHSCPGRAFTLGVLQQWSKVIERDLPGLSVSGSPHWPRSSVIAAPTRLILRTHCTGMA